MDEREQDRIELEREWEPERRDPWAVETEETERGSDA